MQTEERQEEEEISVIIESQDGEHVTVVDGSVIPVDCFVAAEDIAETVVTSTDSDHVTCAEVVSTEDAASSVVAGNASTVVGSGRSTLPAETDIVLSRDSFNVSETKSGKSEESSADSETTQCQTNSDKDDSKVVEVKVIPIEMLYDGTLWSQFDFTKTSDEEMFVSESDGVPLTVSDGVTDVARQVEVTTRSDNMCLSIRDITKREKDRQKKRVLRANPSFREKEKVKAKERMHSRRMDPVYREQERQRDRERRQLARRRNHTMRERERERDKEYKKLSRYGNRIASEQTVTDPCKSLDSFPCQVYLNTQYCTEPS